MRAVSLLCLGALGWASAAPAPGQQPVDVRQAMAPDAAIKVWGGAGSVRVEGWDADSLAVTGEVAAVGGGRFFLVAESNVAKLGIEGPQADVRGALRVRVPATATVWIRTGSADVVVRGLTGAVDIRTAGGSVDVMGQPTTLYAESIAGDLDLVIQAGIVRARTGTGHIGFAGTAQDLALTSVGGAVDITAAEVRRGEFSTVQGDIAFAGSVRPAGALAFDTHSGDITLRLPPDLDADYDLSTFQGRIEARHPDAGDPVTEAGRSTLEFEAGTGGAEVEARSWSGTITLDIGRPAPAP